VEVRRPSPVRVFHEGPLIDGIVGVGHDLARPLDDLGQPRKVRRNFRAGRSYRLYQ
jgi:hypothetical protein